MMRFIRALAVRSDKIKSAKDWLLKYAKDQRVAYGFLLGCVLSTFYGVQYIAPFWLFGFLVVEDYKTNLIDTRIIIAMTILLLFYTISSYYMTDISHRPAHNPLSMYCYFWTLFMGIHLLSCKKVKKEEVEKFYGTDNEDSDEKDQKSSIKGMALMPAVYLGMLTVLIAPHLGFKSNVYLSLEMFSPAAFWILPFILFNSGLIKQYYYLQQIKQQVKDADTIEDIENHEELVYRFGDGDAWVFPALATLFSTYSDAYLMIWMCNASFIILYAFKCRRCS